MGGSNFFSKKICGFDRKKSKEKYVGLKFVQKELYICYVCCIKISAKTMGV